MIEIHDVSHRFGDAQVLSGLDLRLAERRIGIVGANGSGKSTFARLLNGLVIPTSGRVLIDGLDTRRDGRAVRQRVGFVFQNPDHQIVYPLVEEDLAFGLRNLGLRGSELEDRVTGALGRFGLTHLRKRSAHLLSGGEKQMLALAGVLAMGPSTIVLDEPTTLLDLRNKRRIASALASLEQQVVMVTHDLDLLADFDRVIAIEAGRILADGAPADSIARYVSLMEA
ncbi:MAG: energy-coupling factor ABC transporter ATP-binding protein [Microvirga sp.]|nr:energy-coupling factor ABC transporter ATP-binding protein [Microvirga sp.]